MNYILIKIALCFVCQASRQTPATSHNRFNSQSVRKSKRSMQQAVSHFIISLSIEQVGSIVSYNSHNRYMLALKAFAQCLNADLYCWNLYMQGVRKHSCNVLMLNNSISNRISKLQNQLQHFVGIYPVHADAEAGWVYAGCSQTFMPWLDPE